MIWPELHNIASHGPQPVELHDGRQVDSFSEEWRAECEARRVVRMRSRGDRLGYLARVEERRGVAARKRLERDVLDLWNAARRPQ